MNWSDVVDLAQVVGALAAVIAIPLSVILYLKAKSRGVLSYAFSQPIPLVSLGRSGDGSDSVGHIQILYDGHPVSNVFLLRARLQNHGNRALKRQDVYRPLTLTFPDDRRILDAQIVRTVPDRIEATLCVESPSAVLEFELLNPDDRVYIDFICEGNVKNPTVYAHIEGVTQLVEALWEYRVRKSAFVREALIAALIPAIITTYLLFSYAPRRPNFSEALDIFMGSLIFTYIFFVLTGLFIFLSRTYYRITGRGIP